MNVIFLVVKKLTLLPDTKFAILSLCMWQHILQKTHYLLLRRNPNEEKNQEKKELDCNIILIYPPHSAKLLGTDKDGRWIMEGKV